jgi:hypothetical protein
LIQKIKPGIRFLEMPGFFLLATASPPGKTVKQILFRETLVLLETSEEILGAPASLCYGYD